MKNLKIILAAIILLFIAFIVIISNVKKDENSNEILEDNYKYFSLYSLDEKVGVVDANGKVIIKPVYNEVYIPNQQKDVFICIGENEYKILNSKENDVFQKYEEISVISLSEDTLEIEKNVLMYKENGLYGLLNLDGDVLTDAIYDSISSLKSKPGSILVEKDGLYGIINENGEMILDTKYYTIKSDEYCTEEDGYNKTGYIISQKTKNGIIYGYANANGEILISPKYESITRVLEYQDDDIYLIVMDGGKKGVIKNKKQLIKNKFQSILYYDVSNIFIVNKNGKYGFYNQSGKEIFSPQFTEYSLAGDYIFVKDGSESKLYDTYGNVINNSDYVSIIETENSSYFIAQDEKGYYSIISKDVSISNNYISLTYAYDDNFIFTNEDGKSGVLNVYTGVQIEPVYDYILVTVLGKCLEAKNGNVTDIYSSTLNKTLSIENGIVENIDSGYILIHSNGERNYLNTNGEIVSNTEVYPNLNLYSFKSDDGKWGYKNKSGEVVVSPKYDYVTEVNSYGFAGICQDDKWGVIDSEGKVIVVPCYNLEVYYDPEFIGKYLLEKLDIVHCTELEN